LQLQEEFAGRITAITLNVDHDEPESLPSETLRADVLERLSKLKMTCQNVIASDSYEIVLEHYDVFALPAALVFGPDGKLQAKLDTEFSYVNDVRPMVMKLLNQSN
jgi:hypothetical protein